MEPRDIINTEIKKALAELQIPECHFSIEHPSDITHGDYATNVALIVAKHLNETPRIVAERFKKILDQRIPIVARIDIAGPGFINFYLHQNFFVETVTRIISNSELWGTDTSLTKKEIMCEYTSPNLFKPLHVGNLVGNIIGEWLARVYEYTGATVYRINYPSDIGPTVAKGVWGILHTHGDPNDITQLGQAYVIGNEAYERGGTEKEEIEHINRSLYLGDDEKLNVIRAQGIQTSLARLNELCRILGTSFDTVIFESEAGPIGTKVVQENISSGIFEKSNGAIVYAGERVGLHTRVFINSQGLPTYEAKDIGNFTLKQQQYPNWKQSIVVTGNEQTEYFKVLKSAIEEIFPESKMKKIEHVPTGFLTLSTGKMSSRKGNVLTGESLLEELREEAKVRAKETRSENIDELADMIAVGALKYQILRQKVGTSIIFDKQQALSFEGNSGPYLQYTHARTVSICTKAKDAHTTLSTDHPPVTPYKIERLLYRFPETIAIALRDRSPHHIVTYLTELASAFNAFYAEERIITDDETASYKVALTDAVRITLERGLYVLGIGAPKSM